MAFIFVAIFACLVVVTKCDTPANCSYSDVKGLWEITVGNNTDDGTKKLGVHRMFVDLMYPDVAVDQLGNRGFWTMIYNQGFEIVIIGRKFFAFSKYIGEGENATSFCDETFPGWSHDVLGHNWVKFSAKKVDSKSMPKLAQKSLRQALHKSTKLFSRNKDFIDKINSDQRSWTATYYTEYEQMSIGDLMRRAGGSAKPSVKCADVSDKVKNLASSLPNDFDWRNVDGINFVSPVRNQGSCGSCYAFSSMAMIEARLRILTNNSYQPVLSPQDIVECSEYSQGCMGGFPYLIGGKYAEDYGLVDEKCNLYKGKDGKCSTDKNCRRHYATNYRYVGGYYGACNAELMKVALYHNGPMTVSFMVYSDFLQYKGGIYHYTGLEDKFNPFEITNHAVLLVGYGRDAATGEDFWTIKNSWGTSWGEKGFFRIRRGYDECSVESMAVEADPVM